MFKKNLKNINDFVDIDYRGFNRKEEPFREWFSRIGELMSLFPTIPVAALTATLSISQRKKIMSTLCFDNHAVIISKSPDRGSSTSAQE
jgi:hypothetical protein